MFLFRRIFQRTTAMIDRDSLILSKFFAVSGFFISSLPKIKDNTFNYENMFLSCLVSGASGFAGLSIGLLLPEVVMLTPVICGLVYYYDKERKLYHIIPNIKSDNSDKK